MLYNMKNFNQKTEFKQYWHLSVFPKRLLFLQQFLLLELSVSSLRNREGASSVH